MSAEYENAPLGEKRKVLVAASPSPKKRRNINDLVDLPKPPLPLPKLQSLPMAHVPRASNMLSVLASAKDAISSEPQESVSFHVQPPKNTVRDPETLRIIERLELGPYEHKPHKDDPEFKTLEPHSGLRLQSRSISHEDLSEYMRDRYYISPSTLYSIATLSPSKEAYEVPVEGAWVTIAVIAHREDVRLSNPSSRNDEDGSQHGTPQASKYTKFRLVDFGTPTADNAGTTRGDAMLNMFLFEASSVSEIKEDDSKSRGKKTYKGGSGGAFEAPAKYREGTVIAVLNPIVLRPFKGSQGTPHPTQNILAIKPRSPDCIQVIGQSKDLGLCSAIKRDGSSCGSWYDRRSSNVCEYHIQTAVKSRRAARPEFSAATSGMQTSAVPKGAKKQTFDPLRKHGLLPSSGSQLTPWGAGATYIVGGYVLDTTTKHDPSDRYTFEHMGREKEERRKRQIEGEQADKRLLEHLIGHETLPTTGARALRMAREQLVAGKNKTVEIGESTVEGKARKSAFSASALQRIGFDPTLKGRVEKKPKQEAQRKLEALSKAGGSSVGRLGKPPKKTDEDKAQSPVNKVHEEVKEDADSGSDLEIV